METTMKIRRQILVEGRSIRSVSRETGISRNTIRKYLKDDQLPKYKPRQNPSFQPKLKDYEVLLRQWYDYDQQRPKRERRTAQKLFEQLIFKGYQGSYSPVCRFIKKLKMETSQISKAFIPLLFEPGDAMQFDWSTEVVVLGGIKQKIKVAHFRFAHSRKPFVIAYHRETQEMLLDAFAQALAFYGAVPKRVLIDNPKTMVVRIGSGKERDFHPRFMAMMNHYLMEPVACTPASGWEKGQIENQVNVIRNQLFKPQLRFDSLAQLNVHLLARCQILGDKDHPQDKAHSIDEMFAQEQPHLMPLGKVFDGYVERPVRVSGTCLVQFDNNHYSVPAKYARQRLSLRAYANRIVLIARQKVIAEHSRSFKKNEYHFEPWHYVPLLEQKPGALRNGAPFKHWNLPEPLNQIKRQYIKRPKGDREFVRLLQLIQEYDLETVTLACEWALEEQTIQLSAITNLIHRLQDEGVEPAESSSHYPQLQHLPEANCHRYEQLLAGGAS